jgi:hypothetical protein
MNFPWRKNRLSGLTVKNSQIVVFTPFSRRIRLFLASTGTAMKKIFFLLLTFFQLSQAFAQAPAETIRLKETEFDFGKIPQGKPVYHVFELVNTGTAPMKLDNVSASCGCTTPEWSRDPIPAGGTTLIRVGFNAATEGPFEKPITITAEGQTKQVKIKGLVWKAPQGAAPANASVHFLKQQIQ